MTTRKDLYSAAASAGAAAFLHSPSALQHDFFSLGQLVALCSQLVAVLQAASSALAFPQQLPPPAASAIEPATTNTATVIPIIFFIPTS